MLDLLSLLLYFNNTMLEQRKRSDKMRGIIIARVSKSEQSEEGHYSLDVQVKKLREYAKSKGVEIVEECIIKGESAYRGNRNLFTKAIDKGIKMSSDEGFALFIQNPDRFSREVASKVVLKVEDLRKAGKIKIYSLNPEMVLHKDSSAMELGTWNILIAVASMQSGITSDKIKASVKHKLENNEYPGFAPTGYLQPFREDGKKVITIDKERAPLIKELFELYATGNYSMRELTRIMREKGLTIKPKKKNEKEPKLVKKSDIEQILDNKFYTGWFDWDGVEYKASNYEAIITRELFNKVQKILGEKAIRYSSKHVSTAKFFRYRGLLKCGFCGCVLTPSDMSTNYKNVEPGSPGSVYYRCTYSKKADDADYYKDKFGENGQRHSGVRIWKDKEVHNCPQQFWSEEQVDQEIKKYLKRLAFDKSVIQKIKKQIGVEFKTKMSATTLQKKSVEAEVVKKAKLIEGLIDKLAMSELVDISVDIQDRIKVIKSEVEELKVQLSIMDDCKDGDLDQVINALSLTSDLYKKFDKLSPMDKRRVVTSAFSELQLRKGWIGNEKEAEETFNAKWSEPFHELWFQWVKNHVNLETLGRELEYEEYINSLDESYLEDDEEVDQEDDNNNTPTGEDLIKTNNTMRRAGRAWYISHKEM